MKSSGIWKFAGFILVPAVWLVSKAMFGISDRYLPSLGSVIAVAGDIEPSLFIHASATFLRLVIGLFSGIAFGMLLGIGCFRYALLKKLFLPAIQTLRSIPPIATVPFFLLWFGFSEMGKLTLIVVGIGFNIAIAVFQIVSESEEKFAVMFRSFGLKPNEMIRTYLLPLTMSKLLPTVRFSLSTTIGLVIVSELLGSQVGLGYLIQTARSTFSINVIFLVAIILGITNYLLDLFIILVFKKIVYWHEN
ncbi:MAG: ABC transporter permease subunit [Bacteroidetes bacterium]|nr:ABC transporter permease subunit [Bacteroidota bacterium]